MDIALGLLSYLESITLVLTQGVGVAFVVMIGMLYCAIRLEKMFKERRYEP